MKAVIFDMDGVLIDSEPLWKIAEVEGFAKVGLDLSHTDCEETVGLRIDEVVKLWHNKVGWTNKTLKEVEDDIVNTLIREIEAKGQALVGVYEALDQISSAGIKIGLATSSASRILEVVLDKLKISDYFEAVHSAEYETHGKPHPAVFLSAAKKLNIDPIECLVVEDSLNGVIAAKASRMKVIAVPEKSHIYDERLKVADHIIESLKEFDVHRFKTLWEN